MAKFKPIGIAIHGGASADDLFTRTHKALYEQSLSRICTAGYKMLLKKRSALDTVFEVLAMLEDDPLFNSGRGSALNEQGRVHMDAAVMEGKDMRAGAVALLEQVKNPSALIREILKDATHIFLGGQGALELAIKRKLELMPESYFVTERQVSSYLSKRTVETTTDKLKKKMKGTTGVVVCDNQGNVAAGTSTGGIENSLHGRIGDSCVLGAGCYACNNTCAISATGDGEYIIQGVVAHAIASYIEYTGAPIQEACNYLVNKKNRNNKGDLGVIGIDPQGNVGIAFNTERMHRAWISDRQPIQVKVYK
jgi:L-asparaginase / beta-aspartyl-peptidase